MGSREAEVFNEIDKFRVQLLHNVEVMTDSQRAGEEISQ